MMETLERHSDSIDKLTSLVSKMNVKMDKKEIPYKPRVYQNRLRGKSRDTQQISSPAIDLLAGIEIVIEGIIIIIMETIDPIIEMHAGMVIDGITEEVTTGPKRDGITIDKTIGEIATDKTIEIGKIIGEMTPDKYIEAGVKVGIDQEIIVMT